MDKRRFLIITGGNEGASTALMLREELVSNYGSLDNAPSIVRYLALNTDGFSDAQYPEEIRFSDPEKIKLDIEKIQNLIDDPNNFGHLTSDLPKESVVAEDTKRGAGRTPSQGELGIRYHLAEFQKRLDLILQKATDDWRYAGLTATTI